MPTPLVALYLIPLVLLVLLGQHAWRDYRTVNAEPPRLLLTLVTIGAAILHLTVHALFSLAPADAAAPSWRVLFSLNVLTGIVMIAAGSHVVRLVVRDRAGARWIALNYGTALLLALFALVLPLVSPGQVLEDRLPPYLLLLQLYVIGSVALLVRAAARFAVRRGWRPGGMPLAVGRIDIALLSAAFLGTAGFLALGAVRGPLRVHPSGLGLVLDLVISLSLTIPFAVRLLGEVVRGFLVTGAMLLGAGTIYFAAVGLRAAVTAREGQLLVDVAAVLALVAVLVPGQSWVRGQIDRLVFHRTLRRRAELQAVLHTLSPEMGAVECCRRALAELTRVMDLRGAAIVLRDGTTVREGSCNLGELARLWPRGAAAETLPPRVLVGLDLGQLPNELQEALADTDVVGTAPVASPRGRWGHLFLSAGFLGAAFRDEEVHGIEAFTNQLALLLDGAELLARAVAVERSLAHSEKLAAIGELAARIAHDIRNPVTAARSLAQQLAREPTALPDAEPATLILSELERVERRVAVLLRFARREEFRLEPVDLALLARTTVRAFQPRLDAAGIRLDLRLAQGIRAHADHDKIRQVLVDLVENAIDALSAVQEDRRLTVSVGRENGAAAVRVTDNGPGVPPEVLPRLFEPFFSLKEKGTGLGLAIAHRTVDGHGGRLTAASPCGEGLTVLVELPLASDP